MKKTTLLSILAACLCTPLATAAPNTIESPLGMPYSEGFADAAYGEADWEVIPVSGETATVSLVSHDPTIGLFPTGTRDKGFLHVENDKAGEFYLVSPHILISEGQDDATMNWVYFRSSGVDASGIVQYDGGDWEDDASLTDWGSDDMDPSWTSMGVSGWPPYGSQAGHTFRFGWRVKTNGAGGAFCIDNILFGIKPKYDLGLVRPHATPRVKPGGELTASVEVGVFGSLTTKNFNVTAYLDGEKIGESGRPSQGPWGERHTLCDFKVTLPEDIAIGEHEVTYEVVFEGDYAGSEDADLSNNKASAKFKVVGDFLPLATNLSHANGQLSWIVPAKGERFTDDMESLQSFDDGALDVLYDLHPVYDYDVFARSFGTKGYLGGYTVIDIDQKPTISDENWIDSNVPNLFHLMACTVADFSVEAEGLAAASGDKALLFWGNEDGSPSDNYLVLPALNSADRKVEFLARAYDSDYPEIIEIMTSSTGTDTADFSAAKTVEISDAEFTKIEFEAPENTRYVAIRHISDEGYALLIDDLSYAMQPMEVKGYNVYIEGEKVNDNLLTEPLFDVTTDGNYSVSVVYEDGESEPTAPIYVTTTSVGEISVAGENEPVYYNLQGMRVDNPVNGVFVKIHNGKSTKVAL